MALKELQQGLRRGIFTLPFAVAHILAIIAVLIDVYSGSSIPSFTMPTLVNPGMYFPASSSYCGVLWSVIPIICLLVIPFVAITMMSQELEKGNSELLMLTGLKRNRVVWEKFLAAWSLCLLMLVSFLPYTLVPYWVNGMRILVLLELILSIVFFSGVMCAMVLAVSGYVRIPFRILFFILFGSISLICLSMVFLPYASGLGRSGGVHNFWHYLNALLGTVALIMFGLASAKSQLKLTLFYYEMKPTQTVCLLLFFSPAVAGVLGGITLGKLPVLGFFGMALLSWFVDEPTRSKKQQAMKKLNLPEGVKPTL